MDESLKYLIVLPLVMSILLVFFSSPFRATMYIIAFQKIIDILWFVNVNIGPFVLSVQRIAYTVIPVVLVGVLFVEHHRYKKWPKLPFIKNLIMVYLIWYAISGIQGPFLESSIEYFFKVFAGFIMLFVGWYYFDSEEKFDEFANLYIITYLIPLIGLILQITGIFQLSDIGVSQQLESDYGLGDQSYRYPGFYNDSGTNTMYLWILIPLSLYFINKYPKKWKWFYVAAFFISITAILIGFSRGQYLIMSVVLFGWFFINKKYWVLILGSLGVLIYFIVDDFLRKFFFDLVSLYETGKFASVSGKAAIWDVINQQFEKKSLFNKIFGSGILSNELDLLGYYGYKASGETNWYSYPYDLGYFGFALYIIIPFMGVLLVWRNIKILEHKRCCVNLSLKYMSWFSMACGHLLSLHGSGDRWVSFTLPLWFLAGFALKHPAFYLLAREKSSNDYAIGIIRK